MNSASILALIDLVTDVSGAILSLAEKNQTTVSMLNRAVAEGRFPTPEEHKEIRKGMKDSLEDLKSTYKNMV